VDQLQAVTAYADRGGDAAAAGPVDDGPVLDQEVVRLGQRPADQLWSSMMFPSGSVR
jgi:hypothetical protein